MYGRYEEVGQSGWTKERTCNFSFNVNDTIGIYDVSVSVRNSDLYPYSNLWLFCAMEKDGMTVRNDTLELILADDFGKWLGHGITLYETEKIMLERFRFPTSGDYTIRLRQGMRNDNLPGIQEIGVKITADKAE
jgi:gliding motility-associated lipoprotein GldH